MRKCIIFVGAPCSGKSEVGKRVALAKNMKYISSGDIARSIPGIEDSLNAGEFAPEQMMRSRIIEEVNKYDEIVLDGFPRYMDQYEYLVRNGNFDIIRCVYIDTDLATAQERAAERGRNDDNIISFMVRYNKYMQVTQPMVNILTMSNNRNSCVLDGKKEIDVLVQEVLYWLGELTIAKLDRCDFVNAPNSDTMAFTIWFSGCHFKCKGCQNPELWRIDSGTSYNVDDVAQIMACTFSKYKINDVSLLGGEPLDQDINQLLRLCMKINEMGKRIWLYTGYDFDDVPIVIRDMCYTIKCGRYIEELRDESRFPITTNQKVYRKLLVPCIWKLIDLGGED